MKAILKQRNHSTIVVIRNEGKNRDRFSFTEIEKKKKLKRYL